MLTFDQWKRVLLPALDVAMLPYTIGRSAVTRNRWRNNTRHCSNENPEALESEARLVLWVRIEYNRAKWKSKGHLVVIVLLAWVKLDKRRLTVSEVAVDQHELMMPRRTMRPSSAHNNEQLPKIKKKIKSKTLGQIYLNVSRHFLSKNTTTNHVVQFFCKMVEKCFCPIDR